MRVTTLPPSTPTVLGNFPRLSVFFRRAHLFLLSCDRNDTKPADEEVKQATTHTALVNTDSGFGGAMDNSKEGEENKGEGKSCIATASRNIVTFCRKSRNAGEPRRL